ncbi:recombinase family protein [Bradyrhizobium sp. 157]|uniref:recombinase family protein n=1 Tax=Bradyrhizobium sp. 157 TaxID=2782631 RepID=UPI001FF9155D|nr:recombinase family protein [Bradyrhizobium sp. 157]MCK1641465.1 recombinase family protein [Bradyrhizobium sp. 157]
MIYGYARVSTGGQSLAGQLAALGLEAGRIFAEKISGAESNRPQLKKLLRTVRAGDVVVVTRLDRMARSTRDLLNILAHLERKKAGFRSIGDPWADTTTPHGRLMVTVMGGMAEFERELIRARTAEGSKTAAFAVIEFRPRANDQCFKACRLPSDSFQNCGLPPRVFSGEYSPRPHMS